MKVLLTGANGYIGLRLLPELLEQGHEVYIMLRSLSRFPTEDFEKWEADGKISYVIADMLETGDLPELPSLDAAYYFLHSMGAGGGFEEREASCAENFTQWVERAGCKQVIYLGGLSVEEEKDYELSAHMQSRKRVGEILGEGSFHLTFLRASIIVGSGSASFEIIRDLVEKLPVMVTPKWTETRCQPIAIRNVVGYLTGVLGNDRCFDRCFDIGGTDILTYKEMLIKYAEVRGLSRTALPVPFLSPKLSSYWLYFMTATTYELAKSLVDSLHIETVCEEESIREIIPQKLLGYEEAISLALSLIAQNRVPSVWYSSLASGKLGERHLDSVHVPEHGVYKDRQTIEYSIPREEVITSVWSLGGKKGWPSMNWAWRMRGKIDKILGGIGVRRGRRHQKKLRAGDALDFWRVILADRENGRLILYAEMKLPGEAWLAFRVEEGKMIQTATYRPKGLRGRAYWWLVYPFHLVLFPAMARKIAKGW